MLPCLCSGSHAGFNLFWNVPTVPFVDNVPKRCEIIARIIFAVHTVTDGYKANPHFRKTDLRVKPDIQIVAPKTGHVLAYDCANQSSLGISDHAFEARSVEVRAGETIVHVVLRICESMFRGVFPQNKLLRSDTVGFRIRTIIAWKAAVQCCDLAAGYRLFLHKKHLTFTRYIDSEPEYHQVGFLITLSQIRDSGSAS